ncbi:MAG: molybdenum cofactor guanylyltransferase MobA [Pseudomonadota bacterium]
MIPAVILAGGASRRMGGGVKPLLDLNGRPMISHVIERLKPQTTQIAINANAGDFAPFGYPLVTDSIPDRPGPLAGILAALDWASAQGAADVVTLAGDTPFFPDDLIDGLMAGRGDAPAAMAATREGDRLFSQSVFGLWSTDLADDLRAAINSGTRKVLDWSEPAGCVLVEFDASDDPFFNINTPDDLDVAAKRLALT